MFETNPTSDDEFGERLNSSRIKRFTVIGTLVLCLMLAMSASPAAAQEDMNLCSEIEDDQFGQFIADMLSLLVFGGVILGTFGILIGFISEASPWVDSKYNDLKSKGLIYGWGIVVVVYFLNFMGNMLFADGSFACFLPFVG